MIAPGEKPRLASKARLRTDKKTGQKVLLYPEKGLLLNPTGARILELCTGERTVVELVDVLVSEHPEGERATIEAEVAGFLGKLLDLGLVRTEAE